MYSPAAWVGIGAIVLGLVDAAQPIVVPARLERYIVDSGPPRATRFIRAAESPWLPLLRAAVRHAEVGSGDLPMHQLLIA